MEHAQKVKKGGQQDTTVDQAWEIDQTLASADRYVMICTALWIVPKGLVFFLPLFITILPWYLLAGAYSYFMPIPTDRVQRSTFGFIVLIECLGRILLFVPRILVFVCLLLDNIVYYLFSVPYCLCSRRRGLAG